MAARKHFWFAPGHRKSLYDSVLKVYCGQILNARGEQFSEPQDGPQGHYRSGVPPPAVDLGTTSCLQFVDFFYTIQGKT
jgi:hypothetical protein